MQFPAGECCNSLPLLELGTPKVDQTSTDSRQLLADLEQVRLDLARSEARFRDVIERNADAIVVVDSEGILQFVNDEAIKLFGERAEGIVGSPFGFPLVAGETTELDLVRDHAPLTVEMRVVASHWAGEPAWIATLRNITERKRVEQNARNLIRSETARASAEDAAAKFRFLAESTALLSSSLDYKATLAALARLCVEELADWVVVYSFGEDGPLRLEVAHRDPSMSAVALALRDLPADPLQSDPIAKLLETRQPRLTSHINQAEIAVMIPDPEHRRIVLELGLASFMLVPIIARDRVLGALALVSADSGDTFDEQSLALATDLASRGALAIDNARLYEEARQANQAKSELLAVVSHDLRTPLNSIIGYGQLLQMGIPDPLPAVARERIDRMLTSAKHQLYLIDGLLHFARLDAGHEELELRILDARAVAQEAAILIESLADEKGLTFDLRLPDTPLTCYADPDKLRQLLINLLSNAVRYTESGAVVLEGLLHDDDMVIRVCDTGIGIAPEHLPHVFEPFWQVDRGQRTRGGGTGLGLAVVQHIIGLLGGRITVESGANGSTFEVRLLHRA